MSTATKVRGSASTTRLRKVECSECGCILRMSRAAMAKCGMPTCGCGARMYPAELSDAYAAGCESIHPDHADEIRREAEKAIREAPKGFGGSRLQCGGCREYIPSVSHACRCGFQNDIRGRAGHNEGHYASGASYCNEWKREQIPF